MPLHRPYRDIRVRVKLKITPENAEFESQAYVYSETKVTANTSANTDAKDGAKA